MCEWNGKFVLRTLEVSAEEARTRHYHIYRYADRADDLSPADNYFDRAAEQVDMHRYEATLYRVSPLDPPRQWGVRLAITPGVWVTMAVFVLKATR